ncbi:MAG: hypothetical protein Ct9H300mP28_15130 [Pseudomonadota bacterium]|nr:MAG: hypothetical protein Ct9H300mP28_15130 [Pseudomonadota bacterium]
MWAANNGHKQILEHLLKGGLKKTQIDELNKNGLDGHH